MIQYYPETWFISDTHFYHKNITRGVSKWPNASGVRDFDDELEMTIHIINQINKYVGEDDTLYILGDFAFGGKDNIPLARLLIHCKKIHYIYGNHDHHIRKSYQHLFTTCRDYAEISIKYRLDTDDANTKMKKQKIILCHYALRVWNQAHHGSWQLHGHSHGSLIPIDINGYYANETADPLAKQIDVGVDSIFNLCGEYRPIAFSELYELFNSESYKDLRVDQHDENTN